MCGPWEEADGFNDEVSILASTTEKTFDDCLIRCCDSVTLGAIGVVYKPTSGTCLVTSENPIAHQSFVEGPFDYGTREVPISAVLLELDVGGAEVASSTGRQLAADPAEGLHNVASALHTADLVAINTSIPTVAAMAFLSVSAVWALLRRVRKRGAAHAV